VRTDSFDLSTLQLPPGGGRRLELEVAVDPFALGGDCYGVEELVPAMLDVSKMTGNGYALKLRFDAALSGPCMRCLEPASPVIEVEAREISQPGEGEELDSPYLDGAVLDVRAWARDALALSMPTQLLCRPDCSGLCPVCGTNLNTAGREHRHEKAADPRWAKLSEIRFE
jgi:uncharacterized protein